MKYKITLIVLGAAMLFQCTTARQNTENAAKAEQIIRQNAESFSRYVVAGDFEAIVQSYTPDAKIFPPGLDILQKTAAIKKYWTPHPDRKSKTVHHKLIPQEITVNGDYAYDWGYYEGRTRMDDGREEPWRGKYVVVWKQSSPGVWKMYLDAWNRVSLD